MWRSLLRWLAPLAVTLATLPPLPGQVPMQPTPGQPPNPGGITPPSTSQGKQGQGKEEEKERNPPALQYFLAFMSTMLILVIVCMPARKG